MKTKTLVTLSIISFFLFMVACTSQTQTPITDEAIFSGEGDHWQVRYTFDKELYEEKKVNWIEMERIGEDILEEDLPYINISIEVTDAVITGNMGDMETKVEGNVITFLVGTVNTETFLEDEYEITINYHEETDKIKLKN